MYRIVADAAVPEQVAALRAEVLDVLALIPWNGQPGTGQLGRRGAAMDVPARPAGQVVDLILEQGHEAHLLRVQWWG